MEEFKLLLRRDEDARSFLLSSMINFWFLDSYLVGMKSPGLKILSFSVCK